MSDAASDRRPSAEHTVALSVGGLLVEALARRDFAAVGDCLEADVHLRALVPPGLREATGRERVVEQFRRWFDSTDHLEMIDATIGGIGSRLYMCWRVRLTPRTGDGAPRTFEQHAFATADERISGLDLLCSGYMQQSR